MKRSGIVASLFASTVAAIVVAAAPAPAPAQTILYVFTALPGQVATCSWFDDNLNDRSLDSLTRQTDLLYNRIALPPGQPITVTQTGTAAKGAQLVSFNLGSKTVCTGADAVYPPTPSPNPSSAPSASPTP